MKTLSGLIALALAVGAHGGGARAQVAFTPIKPAICPTMTTFSWAWDSLSPEHGVEPNGLNLEPPALPGPIFYANNQRQRRFLIGNVWVRNFGYRYTEWHTQLAGDQLLLQQPGQLFVAMSGIRTTPAWVSIPSPTPLQESPIEATFTSNADVQNRGFNIDQVRFCAAETPGSVSATPMQDGIRYSGFLLGTNDVVTQWISAPAAGQVVNVALWGQGSFDVDLYVRCGAVPTPTTYTARGYTPGGEILTISPAQCAAPSILYITSHAYSGSGQFHIVAARGVSPNISHNFTIALEGVTTTERENIKETIRQATRLFFGATEGQWLFSHIRLVLLPANSIPFSMSACQNACYAATGWYCHACFIRETGRALAGAAVIMPSNSWYSAETLNHEWGHYFLTLDDEYDDDDNDCNGCGHSVMSSSWNYGHNLCIGGTYQNHTKDRDPGCAASPAQPAWPTATQVVTRHTTTPDIYNYLSHDFNSLPTFSIH